jgi:exocyst complex component 2
MGKLGTSADEATLLKAYKISTLAPTTWEEIDHELEQSVAGALTGPTPTTEPDGDPLGLGSTINLANLDMESSVFFPFICPVPSSQRVVFQRLPF